MAVTCSGDRGALAEGWVRGGHGSAHSRTSSVLGRGWYFSLNIFERLLRSVREKL